MNLKTLIVLFIILPYSTIIIAQKDKPTAIEVSKAKKWLEKYDDEDVVISDKKKEINFSINRKTKKVEVTEETIITYFAIAARADIGYSTGYDNESEIEKLQLLDKRNRRVSWDIKDEPYTSSSIFHNDYRIQYGRISLPLQGYTRIVKEIKSYKDIKYFTTDYFTDSYRVIQGELKIVIPDWLHIDVKEFNTGGYNISKTSKKDGKNTELTFSYNDVPPIAQESNTQGNSFTYPHILYLAQSYTDSDNKENLLFKDTKDLYNWYKKLVSSVDIDNGTIKEKVAELTSGLTSDDEKIKAIYYWVQDNIKYIAFEDGIAGFKPDSPQNVFKKKYGDCKGMAILLKTMLIEAGFDSRLVWIGTDRIAYDYSTPSLSVDNHMIAAVMKDGKPIFIDGTEKYNSFGTYASRIQGKQALIEDGDDYMLVQVPISEPEFNQEIYKGVFEINNDDIIGKMNKKLTGEQVSSFLYGFNGLKKDKREEVMLQVLADRNDNVTIKNVNGFNPKNRDDAIDIEYDIKIVDAVSDFDNNLYLELDPVRYLADWRFDQERKSSYLLNNTRVESKTIELLMPTGYSIESLPESINLENELLKIQASYSLSNNKVVYESYIKIKKRLIDKNKFDDWNKTIEELNNFYDEQIVLKKN